jgi:hypothetical protein
MATVRKHLRIAIGFAALVAGAVLALPLVPGPGIPLMALGLVMLSDHFEWARRSLDWAKRTWQRIRQ